jgi:hypothetical protein
MELISIMDAHATQGIQARLQNPRQVHSTLGHALLRLVRRILPVPMFRAAAPAALDTLEV